MQNRTPCSPSYKFYAFTIHIFNKFVLTRIGHSWTSNFSFHFQVILPKSVVSIKSDLKYCISNSISQGFEHQDEISVTYYQFCDREWAWLFPWICRRRVRYKVSPFLDEPYQRYNWCIVIDLFSRLWNISRTFGFRHFSIFVAVITVFSAEGCHASRI